MNFLLLKKMMMNTEKGSATLLSLIIMMLLGSLGGILLLSSNTELQIAANQRDGIAAQYLAEAGIQWAIVKLKAEPTFLEETSTTKHVTKRRFAELIPSAGSYTVEIVPGFPVPDRKTRHITATGIVNQSKRQVVAHVTLPQTTSKNNPLHVIWNY